MNKFLMAALAAVTLTGSAEARQGHVLRGLFCNTRSQLQETLDHLREASTLALAIAITNKGDVLCVHAYKIRYIVTHPVIIARTQHNGQPLTLYEATLIGVLVGGNPRPVEPPLKTFFVPMDPIAGEAVEDGA